MTLIDLQGHYSSSCFSLKVSVACFFSLLVLVVTFEGHFSTVNGFCILKIEHSVRSQLQRLDAVCEQLFLLSYFTARTVI